MRKILIATAASLLVAACCKAPAPTSTESTTATPRATAPAVTASSAPAKPAAPAQVVDIKVILKEYKENEVRADGTYKDKTIQLQGVVGEVKKAVIGDGIYVMLGTGKLEFPRVQCFVKAGQEAKASSLNKGATITVKGRVDGLLGNVKLADCDLQ